MVSTTRYEDSCKTLLLQVINKSLKHNILLRASILVKQMNKRCSSNNNSNETILQHVHISIYGAQHTWPFHQKQRSMFIFEFKTVGN